MQAQSALGMSPYPATGSVQKDLESAKQSIDCLGALQEKTQGNLSAEEAHLLENILYELRLAYVEAQ
ncbi:MAG: DUF1844 domain-containing protein [Deltaproteobacteria bacterium]|nr:DUF1844 domain-containing protein [Deltaproteobacteria bacterium]